MGRNRTPPELLDTKGSFLKHPECKRKSEPKIERPAFESLVLLKARERDSTVTGQERGQLISLYSRFALTPADRSRVSVEAPKENALQRFLQKRNVPVNPSPAPVQ
jgi:hypothetical protein